MVLVIALNAKSDGGNGLVKIGLTGGIASGKSTVSKLLEEFGVPVFDADKEVHLLLAKDEAVKLLLKEKFGADIIALDGSVDRKKLGEIVFSDSELRIWLEGVIHVRIDEKMSEFVMQSERNNCKVVVFDIPLLIEKGWQSKVDKVWLVYVPRQIQLERVLLRDGLTTVQAEQRLAAQMPLVEKLSFADLVIDNSGDLEETRRKIKDELAALLS